MRETIFRAGALLMNRLNYLQKFAIVALLLLVAKGYADLHWPSMLLGLVLATQALFFAFWNKEKN